MVESQIAPRQTVNSWSPTHRYAPTHVSSVGLAIFRDFHVFAIFLHFAPQAKMFAILGVFVLDRMHFSARNGVLLYVSTFAQIGR